MQNEEREKPSPESEACDLFASQGERAIGEVTELEQHIVDSSSELITDRWMTLPRRVGLKTVQMLGESGIPENPLMTMRVQGAKVILSLTKSLPKELLLPITWEGAAIRLGCAVLTISVIGIGVSNVVHSFNQNNANQKGETNGINHASAWW